MRWWLLLLERKRSQTRTQLFPVYESVCNSQNIITPFFKETSDNMKDVWTGLEIKPNVSNVVETLSERLMKQLSSSAEDSRQTSVTLLLSALSSPHLLFIPLFLLQVSCRLAHVTCSPASRTPPCGGSSSSSSGGPASTHRAAAPCPSNCTMSGGRGCRKPTGCATR